MGCFLWAFYSTSNGILLVGLAKASFCIILLVFTWYILLKWQSFVLTHLLCFFVVFFFLYVPSRHEMAFFSVLLV